MRGGVVGAIVAVLGLVVAGTAVAATPSYHSPGYKGTRTGPTTQPPPAPAPIPLSAAGRFPQVVVDAAGTSHIVWTEDDGDNPDVVRYCRLKRGSTTCDNPAETQRLEWSKAYGSGDDPSFNVSTGPKIVVVGNQLAIVDYRYPTFQTKPDGSCASCTTLLWVSDDGGNSFSGPAVVGDQDINGGAVAYGPEDDPVIGTITDTVTGGSFFQAIHPGRYTSTQTRIGDQDPNEAYGGSLAMSAGKLYAADADLSNRVFVRRIETGDGADIGHWSASTAFAGTEPTIAGGPGGAFVIARGGFGEPFAVRRIGDDLTASAPTVVSDREDPVFADLFQDPAGRLYAAWENRTGTDGGGVRLRSSADGVHWSDVRPLLPGAPDAGQIDLAATDDGGGVAVMNRGGGVNSVGEIVATAFGATRPTGLPGLGNLAGGGDAGATSGCQRIAFGSVALATDEGCFLHGTGAQSRVSVTTGSLRLNGLEIVPDAGVKVLIDARAHTINTTGTVSVNLRAPGIPTITLWHGELHVDLSAGNGTTLFDFDVKQYQSFLEGFPIQGRVQVRIQGDGVVIPVELRLPPYFGGVTASAVLRADQRTGLHLDTLHIKMANAFIGVLEIRDLDINYRREGSVWDGRADLLIPGPLRPNLRAHVLFEDGDFKTGEIGLGFFPGVPLFPGVYWHDFRLGLGLSPLKIAGGVSVGAVPIPPSAWTVDVLGDMSIQFGTPTVVRLDGTGEILGLRLATAGFTYNSDGYAFYTAGYELGGDWLGIKADGAIYVDPPHIGGKVHGRVCVLGVCPEAVGAVSEEGIAACRTEDSGPGAVYRWGDSPFEIEGSVTSCYIGKAVHLPPIAGAGAKAAQATGARTFTVGPNEPGETLTVTGAGGAPAVTLIDPSGATVTPAPATDQTAPVVAGSDPASPRTLVGLRKPKAGTWTIQPAAGSPAIDSVDQARALAKPKLTARVGGRGRSRTLRYTVSGPPGTSVTFAEVAKGGDHVIGVSKGNAGTLRFAPGGGSGGRRQIVADIAVGGVGFARRTLTSYVAPPPMRPSRPSGVHLRRAGGTVTVTFGRAAGAARYAVTLTSSDRTTRLLVVGAGRRVARFANVHAGTRLRATVRGVAPDGRRGPPARAQRQG